jgi:uncharacterized protein DUF6982
MLNKVVVRFLDGTVLKGTVNNFDAKAPNFHLIAADGSAARKVTLDKLKALFFVKDLQGNTEHNESKDFPANASPGLGKRTKVLFKDGETLAGFCNAYQPTQQGFFLFPVDRTANNDRVYILNHAVKDVQFV